MSAYLEQLANLDPPLGWPIHEGFVHNPEFVVLFDEFYEKYSTCDDPQALVWAMMRAAYGAGYMHAMGDGATCATSVESTGLVEALLPTEAPS